MFAKERQKKISELVQKDGAVTTTKLMELFGVSIETVRRDLLAVEQAGQLQRVHGGAVKKGDMKPFQQLHLRSQSYRTEKDELARTAMDYIQEGDILWIDNGSTAVSVAEAIKDRFSCLTVVTCSADVFEILRDHRDISIILCGGHFMRGENMFVGALALDMLRSIHVSKAFLHPAAISLEHGICCYLNEEQQIQRQVLRSADEIFCLADSSKFEQKALLKVCDINPAYHYVTDSSLPEELKKLYAENGIEIIWGGTKA